MPARTYLIVHGWQASGPGHWQTWLAGRLRDANESVQYPLLPSPDNPIRHEWIEALHAQVALMQDEKIVVCHSLGGVTWLHYAAMPYAIPVDRLLLVAPPCPEVMQRIPELRGFAPVPLGADALSRSAGQCRLVCSSGDAYCDTNAAITYARPLRIEADLLPPEAGHVNIASGYGPWREVEKWCHDPGIRFSESP